MFKNQPDFVKNRMHLMLKGKIDLNEMNAWSADLLSQLKRLKPGFSVISEIAECQPTTEDGRQVLINTQKSAKEMGMGHVIRIIKDSNFVTANQWQRSSRAVGYAAMEAESVDAAIKLLDQMEK